MMKTTKHILLAAIVVASSMLLDTTEAQAQGWLNSTRVFNRGYSYGLSARLYSYPANRATAYSNRPYVNQVYGRMSDIRRATETTYPATATQAAMATGAIMGTTAIVHPAA